MTTTESSFVATASRLVRLVNFKHLKWRHHALGCLQAELDDSVRIHVWSPVLQAFPPSSLRAVHDHRYDIHSAVVAGTIYDMPCIVVEDEPFISKGFEPISLYEILHAKIQAGDDTDVKLLGPAWVKRLPLVAYEAESSYRIERRAFHTTVVKGLTVTVVHRSRFDERPARILDYETLRISGIVKDTDPALVRRVLSEAYDVLHREEPQSKTKVA
jgi:hypothetical protein